jgi:hypothetical protein
LVGGPFDEHVLRSITKNMLHDQQAQLDLLQSGKPVGPRTYEIGINARPEEMLNWDEKVAPNTPVRTMIADEAMKRTGSAYADVRNAGKETFLSAQSPDLTGEGAYRTLSRLLSKPGASSALNETGIPGIKYLDQGSRLPNPTNPATFPTHAAYQDALMRHLLGEKPVIPPQTHNYVVFNPKIIDILKKYGVGSIAALPPAVQATLQQQDNR